MEKILEMKDIVKDFGDFRAVDHVDFSMEKGEIVAIIGPSGSGKSTLLRCINGLNKPTSGEVILKGETGMVFQHFNLFPHMTCMENITYAPIKVKNSRRRRHCAMDESCSRWSDWKARQMFIRRCCPAVRSSGSRLPARWRCIRI